MSPASSKTLPLSSPGLNTPSQRPALRTSSPGEAQVQTTGHRSLLYWNPHPALHISITYPPKCSKSFHPVLEHSSKILQNFHLFLDCFLHFSLTENLALHDATVSLDSTQMEDVSQLQHTTEPGVPVSALLALHCLFQNILSKRLCFQFNAIRYVTQVLHLFCNHL